MKQFASLLILALLWAAPVLGDPISRYTIQRATTPIRVDGHLDEFAWEKAEQINGFERILNDYDQITRPTRAKMLWDDQHLYFAFVCQDPDMWTLYNEEDQALWDEEVVEVFIDPDGDAKNYLELEVTPTNNKVDLVVHTLKPDWDSSIPWDIAGLQSAVQAYGTVDDSLSADQGWTVEIAIPYSAMADGIKGGGVAPKVGDNWRLNLYRIERKAGRQVRSQIVELGKQLDQVQQSMKTQKAKNLQAEEARLKTILEPLQKKYHEETEYTAWSETYTRGFHDPSRFGIVEFGE